MKLDDLPAFLTGNAAPGEGQAPPGAGAVLELHALALRQTRFDAAATAVVSELALRLHSTRVSLSLRDPARPGAPARVVAFSHGAEPDARRQAVRALADAADEALDRGTPVDHPPRPGSQAVPALAHAALLHGADVRAVFSVPFEGDVGCSGVFIFEQREPLDDAGRTLAGDAALFVGPVLLLMERLDAPLLTRVRTLLRPGGLRGSPDGASTRTLITVMIAFGILAALLWPSTHHVVAQARVEGLGQRAVPAPADGFLRTADARPGETVKAGQVLATLDDREPALEVDRTAAERAQHERQYSDALTRDDAGQIMVARAKLELAQAQHALALRRLERTRLTAPFDGVLLSGDLGPMLGMPVKRGQELMIVAPAQGWRVVAEVDEQDIVAVQPGQKARVLFAALAGQATEFTVARLAPVAVPLEGRNVFEVEGQLAAGVDGLRPGLRGVARIEAGERSAVSVWWERGANWLRRLMWTWMA